MDSTETEDGQTFQTGQVCRKWLEGYLLHICFLFWPLGTLGQGLALGH